MNTFGATIILASVLASSGMTTDSPHSHETHPTSTHETHPTSQVQAAIDEATPGATVEISPGHYRGQIVVDRAIELVGGPEVMLDGGGEGSVVTILAPGVTLRGFQIMGTGSGPVDAPSAVLAEGADGLRLQDLTITDSYIGITIRETEGVAIEQVRITGREGGAIEGEMHAMTGAAEQEHGTHDGTVRGDGIWLWNAVQVVVSNSEIRAVRDGIYLSYGSGAVLEGNHISDSRYAIHDMYARDLVIRHNDLTGNLSGLVLMYGGPVLVEGNAITDSGSPSTGVGVLVKDAGNVQLVDNSIVGNRVGLHVDDAGRTGGAPTWTEGNLIGANQVGVLIYPSADATFTKNSFVENVTQVVLGGVGTTQARWSDDGHGNYWSGYMGFDGDGNGVGDVPYAESGRVSELVARAPVLLALASGPAFRLMEAVDERWLTSEPMVFDHAPIMAPPVTAIGAGTMMGPGPVAAAGLAVFCLGVAGLFYARRPRAGGLNG